VALDNYVRFVDVPTLNGIVSQGQQFMSQQAEESQRRLSQVADVSRRTVEAVAQSGKSASEEVSRQQRSKQRGLVDPLRAAFGRFLLNDCGRKPCQYCRDQSFAVWGCAWSEVHVPFLVRRKI
jgi:hypothetical protein